MYVHPGGDCHFCKAYLSQQPRAGEEIQLGGQAAYQPLRAAGAHGVVTHHLKLESYGFVAVRAQCPIRHQHFQIMG